MMDDYMEYGDLVSIGEGWFLETSTGRKFKMDENGNPVDEHGHNLTTDDQEVGWEEDYDR